MSRRKKGRRRGTGMVSITVIVLAFMVVMAVQIYRIKEKDDAYVAREQELKQEYQDETQRASEIGDLETYMKSSEYIEDVAKSKLGLTYKNEIIFKESRD
ncbi:MAG: septum formation initiator family protein [Lachnospiraceae bacterium]|nr:septum formation initiator family protein [Agathobacter sp.]MDD6291744.1 septum formation initiator family protein [Lachnospiraceae bacterium]